MKEDFVKKELISCIKFFLDTYSRHTNSYGLVPDIYPMDHRSASIAGTGYAFTALVLAVKYELLDFDLAKNEALKILTCLESLESSNGWYYHFYNIDTGEKCEWLELSNIDSALLFCGMLTAGAFFKGEVLTKALTIFNKADFNYFLSKYKTMLSMAVDSSGTFIGHWDIYAEQLMLYVLGAASENVAHRLDKQIYYNFKRTIKSYKEYEFICSWYGSLFTFQYSHAYCDFRQKVDENGTNWFENSVIASKAAYQYAKDSKGKFKSFHEKSWGLTACLGKNGYSGLYGNPPTGLGQDFNDGTVSPCGAIGSIVFTPKESIAALNYYYSIPQLIGDYGLYDSYNEDVCYFANKYVAIDKGIEMAMIANYLDGTVWELFSSLEIIKNAFTRLGFKEV